MAVGLWTGRAPRYVDRAPSLGKAAFQRALGVDLDPMRATATQGIGTRADDLPTTTWWRGRPKARPVQADAPIPRETLEEHAARRRADEEALARKRQRAMAEYLASRPAW